MTDALVLRGTKRPSCAAEKQGNGLGGPFGHCRKLTNAAETEPQELTGQPEENHFQPSSFILFSQPVFQPYSFSTTQTKQDLFMQTRGQGQPWVSLLQLTCVLEECLTRQTYS